MVDKESSRFPKIGKLSVAILEHLVEKIIGEKAIDEVKAPHLHKELKRSLGEALSRAEGRFIKQHQDKRARDMVLQLPISDLPSTQEAVWSFYKHSDEQALRELLVTHLEQPGGWCNIVSVNSRK